MQKYKEKMNIRFFSIKIKNIFQKIRYSKEIALSSIADKENRRISLTGRCPLVSRKNRDTNEFKRETDILSACSYRSLRNSTQNY